MTPHPPWLRFQAYVVGLAKTGSTSMATIFGRYRTGHEWQLHELTVAGLARRRGDLSDEAFLRTTGRRLDPPALELDSTTSHRLYVDLLLRKYPHAVFFHTIRDVRSWATSVLDMVLLRKMARRLVGIPFTDANREIVASWTEGTYVLEREDDANERVALPPLMRAWAAHMREMAALLPPERSLVVRTREIPDRLPEIARLAGVPASTLRADLAHVNRSPLKLDRFALFDGDALREAYDTHCAELMAELFPAEHAAWVSLRKGAAPPPLDWASYHAAVEELATRMVALHGERVAR